ncbi:ROK family transcriptional regulator [Anaeropeptidivorans aminofermentans]|uniref:ROK family transcriptional regulator n=1 Tax=Anaeropeptidivorans aminofermentans TaxID=2934315 RepID=UPI002025212A|nr:ROK family transcriptional regulator [Anaeropeptidivorans aminofermentans]
MSYADASAKNNSAQSILNAVRRSYPVTRLELSEMTELSIPSVSRILSRLFEEGYLEEVSSTSGGLGRKTKLITLKDRCVLTAGTEYDGESLKVSIIDEKGRIVTFKTYDTKRLEKEPRAVCEIIYDKIRNLFHDEKINIERLFGIGISLPGIINNESGEVMFSAQLGWKNVKLQSIMEEVSGINCVIDNDIKSAAYAEYNKGVAKNSKISVLLYFGTGLGSAVIIDGNVLRGVTNSAGELGHITQDISGILCTCGKIGCMQTNIAKKFILEEAGKFSDVKTVGELLDVSRAGEKWAERIVNRFVTYAALAVDTAVCAYNPDTVIFCGDLINDTPELYDEICKVYYNNYICEYLRDTFEIKQSTFEGNASIVGIGMLAAEKFFKTV